MAGDTRTTKPTEIRVVCDNPGCKRCGIVVARFYSVDGVVWRRIDGLKTKQIAAKGRANVPDPVRPIKCRFCGDRLAEIDLQSIGAALASIAADDELSKGLNSFSALVASIG